MRVTKYGDKRTRITTSGASLRSAPTWQTSSIKVLQAAAVSGAVARYRTPLLRLKACSPSPAECEAFLCLRDPESVESAPDRAALSFHSNRYGASVKVFEVLVEKAVLPPYTAFTVWLAVPVIFADASVAVADVDRLFTNP